MADLTHLGEPDPQGPVATSPGVSRADLIGRDGRDGIERTLPVQRPDTPLQHICQLPESALGEPDIPADADVGLQLRLHAGQCRREADGGQLAALPVGVVTFEDRAEQVVQAVIYGRRDFEQRAFTDWTISLAWFARRRPRYRPSFVVHGAIMVVR